MSYPYHADHPNVTGADINPSTPELPELQQETPALDVKGEVEIVNAVRTYILPSRIGIARSITVGDDPVILFGSDLRRRRAIIMSADTDFYIGSKDDVRGNYAAKWLAGRALELQNTQQMYAKSATPGTPANLAVITENWAD